MKKIRLLILLLPFLVACEGMSEVIYVNTPQENNLKIDVDAEVYGKYKEHSGEKNKGTVVIENNRITINTLDLDFDTLYTNCEVEVNPNCWILIKLPNCTIKISIDLVNNRISISVLKPGETEVYYGSPQQFGNFDKIIDDDLSNLQ